ncbi:hypothetical protein MLD38_036988 [Melastoma candidum]|uniref:Uncharacterized protein n=1 Tax=Melastoma candidum TaxID=119954 RepID=A0ACB9LKX5_9MYRT|nr:hypothetical protein MLD38_036988 [Melastoma candidum]
MSWRSLGMWAKVLLVVLVAFEATLCSGETDARDVAAINSLYVLLGFPPLKGWILIGGDPCGDNWQGVECVIRNITALNLSGANLGGELGDSLDFRSLMSMDFSNNFLSGSIPSSLPSTLLHMSLANNHFTKEIPDVFEELSSLITLDLSSNNLTGPLPPSFRNLSSLNTLHLENNELIGTLDPLENLPLIDLNVENNLFSGPIPPELLTIPNFKKDGNPFNTTVLPSPPSPPPLLSPLPALAPSPTRSSDIGHEAPQPTEGGGFTGKAPPSPISKGNSKNGKVVMVVGIGAFAAAAVLGVSLFLWMCGKKMRVHGSSKRQEAFSYGNPRGKDNCSDSSRMQFMAKEKAFPREDIDQLSTSSVEQGTTIGANPKPRGDEHRINFTEIPQRLKQKADLSSSNGSYPSLQPPPAPPFSLERAAVANREPNPPTISRTQPSEETVSSRSVKEYTIAALQQLTDSFSPEHIVCEDDLGKVYLAELPDGKHLAVKKLEVVGSKRQSDEGFRNLVSELDWLRHDNILELVGYCAEHGQRLLVYRFCKNGNLQDALHLDDRIHKKLSWAARVRVALGTARALEYLHEVCHPPVVHRIFTSASVLLDDNLEARVSGCGLAPLLVSNSIGQLAPDGYGAPETESGTYTSQSDVYSFGVVMLELLTGRKSLDRNRPRGEQFLVRWAASRLHDIEALSSMVDPSLGGVYPTKSLSRFADIISRCIQREPEFRPPMSEIVQDLLRTV